MLGTSQIIIRYSLLGLHIWLINLAKFIYFPLLSWELSILTAKERGGTEKLGEPYVICFNFYIVYLYVCVKKNKLL